MIKEMGRGEWERRDGWRRLRNEREEEREVEERKKGKGEMGVR